MLLRPRLRIGPELLGVRRCTRLQYIEVDMTYTGQRMGKHESPPSPQHLSSSAQPEQHLHKRIKVALCHQSAASCSIVHLVNELVPLQPSSSQVPSGNVQLLCDLCQLCTFQSSRHSGITSLKPAGYQMRSRGVAVGDGGKADGRSVWGPRMRAHTHPMSVPTD